MYVTYVLRSIKDHRLYIGHTGDLQKRLEEHNAGRVRSTKSRRPFAVVHTQTFSNRAEARWQEKKWKTAWGHKQLQQLIPQSENLSNVGA